MTDKAGNPASAIANDSKDATAPTIAIGNDGSHGDSVYNLAEVTAGVVVSGSTTGVEQNQQVTVTFTDSTGAKVSTTANVDANGNWTASSANLGGLKDGNITVTANVTDKAGNPASAIANDSKDATAPDAPVVNFLSTGLSGAYYALNDTAIQGGTPLAEVLKDIQNGTPTATFVAQTLNFNTVSNNLGSIGNLSTFLGGNASNLQFAGGSQSTSYNQAILKMNGAFSAAAGTYTLTVTADDGYQILVDGQPVTDNSNHPAATATYTLNLSATAGNLHTIQVVYWDQGGVATFKASLTPSGSSTATPINTVTANTVTATVTLDAQDQTDLNNGGKVHITSSSGTDVTLHLSGSNLVDAAGTTVYAYQNGVIYLPVSTPAVGTNLTVTATVLDAAGNVSLPGSNSYHLPSAPPVLITTDGDQNGYLNSAELTAAGNKVSSTVQLDPSVISAGGSANIVVVDAGVTTTLQVNKDGSITGQANGVTASYSSTTGQVVLTMGAPGDAKSVSVTATQTDNFGNVSGSKSASALEDITAPTVAFTGKLAGDDIINAAEHNQALTINGTTTGVEDGQKVDVVLGGVHYSATVTGNAWSLSVPATAVGALADGNYTVTANVSDKAGNPAAQATHPLAVDTVAPTIAIAAHLSTDDVINAVEHNQQLTINGTTSGVENNQVVDVVLGGVHYSATVTNNAWTLNVPAANVAALADGNYTVTANVSDLAGNAATQATHALGVDTTLPTVNLVSNIVATQLFNTTWESVSQNTNVNTPSDGWKLVTTNDVAPGGINGFEIWTSSDTMTRADGSSFTPSASSTGGSNWLELNNSTSNIIQTLGITRDVTTVAGAQYTLSLDYAGRPGYSSDVNKIGVLVDGKLVAEYSATSGSTLDWHNISFNFTGSGGTQTITILTDTPAAAVDPSGRGAMVDNIVLTQGGFQAADSSGLTTIGLSNLLTASHPVAVSAETLTLNISGLTTAEGAPSLVLHGTTYTPDASGNLSVSGLSLSDLQSGSLQLSGNYHGQVTFNATVTATETNGNTATSSTVPVTFTVANGNEVHGASGTDYLYGGAGATLLQGGAGNDTMTGGTGVDTFKWVLGDQGTTSKPAVDTIINFNTASKASGGDVLDLRDLLQGEHATGSSANLTNYLHFTTTTSGGVTSTVVHVSETGTVGSSETQQIVLQGVDLTHSGGATLTDTQIIQNLLTNNKLITD